ncbi:sodium:solute symporter family protein [Cardinium endosymbiont of Bemisia tabaci]|uniref:sodium:solute symporter family protein n=1 Tax=Cardinium endosymbiont of Bemisia tabaci TaxID=672794 RepID=UPI000442D19A|nr:hypothetical protein [Cardinium endosymbiont of Bemisia tabaci]CDG49381.1 Sodium:solute symporter family protein [Cardinium endosymbiont cBtQ1 of Bemisia tabaci]
MVIALCPLLLLSWLAGRMSKFIYHLSMPETMDSAYGRYARLITALFEVCNASITISLQVRIMSDTVSLFLPSGRPLTITILITLVMVIYAIFGGARAIAFTDVWQSIVFSIFIVVVAWLVFKKIRTPIIEIIDFLKSQKQFGLYNIIPSGRKVVPTILSYLTNLVAGVGPYLVQHVYMCKSPAQARKACLCAAIFSSVIAACIIVVGLLVFVCFPHVPSKAIWNHFLANASYPLKTIVSIVMLSFAMSTVDSRLHVASIMLAYDIPKSIGCFRRFLYFHQLQAFRVALFVVSLFTIVLAFNLPTSTLYNILMWYLRFYVPVIIAPFILAVLGLRTSSSVGLIGMATGLLSMLAWQKWMVSIVGTATGHVPCMLINGLVMIVVHYLLRRTTNKLNKPLDMVKSIQQENGL